MYYSIETMQKILVIAAHPDDEILGCGATVARLAGQGAQVRVVILGEGLASRLEDSDEVDSNDLEMMHSNTAIAAKTLGLEAPILHSLPDNRFDSVPLLDIVKIVEKEIRSFGPSTVFTHFGGDLNIDHSITFRAVLTALRPMQGNLVKRLLAFEIPSATEWSFGSIQGSFKPDTFFDISTTVEAKIEAMQTYESESRPFPHPRSPQTLRALAKVRGSCVGLKAAEAFQTIFSIC